MKPHTVAEEGPLLATLFKVLSDRKKTTVRQLLKFGSVLVNGKPVRKHDHPLKPGDTIALRDKQESIQENLKPVLGLRVLYEDASIIVVEKPSGLLTMGTEDTKENTLYWKLTTYARTGSKDGQGRVFIVHRLDRDASGLLVFAKTERVQTELQKNWSRFSKKYYAVVEGVPSPESGTIDNFLVEDKVNLVHVGREGQPGAQRAISKYRVMKKIEDLTLVQVELVTGKKNQIRVHMAGIGCPISGDDKYGAKTNAYKRLALHAYFLSFQHPVTGETLTFTTPLPPLFLRPVRPRRQEKEKPRGERGSGNGERERGERNERGGRDRGRGPKKRR